MNKQVLLASIFLLMCLLSQAQTKVALSDLNLRLMTTGYGNAKANRSIDGNSISLNGKQYQGVGTHAESRITISLQAKASRFSALVGVDDEATAQGSVIFRLIADGKEIFKSPLMRKGSKPKKINVILKGVNTLILEALPGDDGINGDHADWADAYIEMIEGNRISSLT